MKTVLDLFSGGGGLLSAVLHGWDVVAAVEMGKAPCAVIRQRMADGWLPSAPVHEMKVGEFVARHAWEGMADIICAGFPCQPFSAAGKRAGKDDERNGWPETAEAIRKVKPAFLMLENVAGLVSHDYFRQILAELVGLGYDLNWGVFSAADVGAPHERKRLWIWGSREPLARIPDWPLAELRDGKWILFQQALFAPERLRKIPANGRLRGNVMYTAEWPKSAPQAQAGRPWQTARVHDSKPLSLGEFRRNSPPLMAEVVNWSSVSASMWNDGESPAQFMERRKVSKAGIPLAVQVRQWATVTASDYRGRGPNSQQQGIQEQVRQWATVTGNGNSNRKEYVGKSGDGLATQVKNWATVTSTSNASRKAPILGTRTADDPQVNLVDQAKFWEEVKKLGSLNPLWVEPFMGWPLGWTLAEPLARLEWPARDLGEFVLGQGYQQRDWEPPRLEKGVAGRQARIVMLGNGQVPMTAVLAWEVLSEEL
jgi:DNA-cytosine methyltransferase